MRRKGVVFSKMFVLRSMGNELVPSPHQVNILFMPGSAENGGTLSKSKLSGNVHLNFECGFFQSNTVIPEGVT